MKIILFGKNGQVGNEICKLVTSDLNFISYNSTEINFLNQKKIQEVISRDKPNIIINAAAYTKVDEAEDDFKNAYKINSLSLKTISECALKQNATLIHYSTDYVFDGNKKSPYTEDDICNPISKYGITKLEGEKNIIDSGCKYKIFRTSWVVSEHGNNFIKTIFRLANERENLKIVSDQVGVPTSARLIASVTLKMIKSNNINKSNIYNLVPNGKTNWYKIACYIINYAQKKGYKFKLDKSKIFAISSKEYKTRAKRPQNSLLSNLKLSNELNEEMPEWQENINPIIDRLLKN